MDRAGKEGGSRALHEKAKETHAYCMHSIENLRTVCRSQGEKGWAGKLQVTNHSCSLQGPQLPLQSPYGAQT